MVLMIGAAASWGCGSSGGGGNADTTAGPCAGVTCGGHGDCVVKTDGSAACMCESGFSAVGLSCVSTMDVPQDLGQDAQPDPGICTPQCLGKECGPNGCGGLCGTCPAGEGCDPNGKCCKPSCAGRSCGELDPVCKMPCTACEQGSCCEGKCVLLGTDEANCGKCKATCDQTQACVSGECLVCAAKCEGKQCGPDGCGGSCGTCGAGTVCLGGKCEECIPNCMNKTCGDDGCGGSCGKCPGNQKCVDGQCVGCTPSCVGKNCGEDDGCGNKCSGTAEAPAPCPGGGTCQAGTCVGGCVPDCSGKECGYDGCGGYCGQCPYPQNCEAGKCVCTPWCQTKGYLCGSDGCGGQCGTCPPPDAPEKTICGPWHFCIEDAKIVGCSDATREGFVLKDASGNYVFKDIASCAGSFEPQSLRASKTGKKCGNSIGSCVSPADLCADGWHICMNNGWPGDLADRISEGDCHSGTAGDGVFAAASNSAHGIAGCTCTYEPSLPLPCTNAWDKGYGTACVRTIACGTDSILSKAYCGCYCDDAVWKHNTSSVDTSCNNASGITGVLCCKDPPVVGH